MTEVVAALIWDKDKFMICQRPAHKARGLLWEFVGGKVEPGETKEQALIRECHEELAVTLSVGDMFMDVVHEYPDLTVHLTLQMILERAGCKKVRFHDLRHPYVKYTTKIFSLRLMDFQAQAYPDARRKTRGACQPHRGGQSQSPARPLCNRKRFSCLPPQ